METHGPMSAAEASAALASVERSRMRVAWSGYPRWYWLATAAGMAVLPVATLLPAWLGVTVVALVAFGLFRLIVAVGRLRGVCEGWTGSAMRWWEVTVLYGPAVVVMNVGAFMSPVAWWLAVVAAALVFVLFAGTAFTFSARAARR
jgi:hypothetical protein